VPAIPPSANIASTPPKPSATPSPRAGVSFSSEVAKCATSTVNSGVIAFRTEASAPVICPCASTNSVKGTALFKSPITNSAGHNARGGSAAPFRRTTPHRISAARPTRPQTTVKGGRPASASSLNKKDPPHKRDRVQSKSQSLPRIRVLHGAGIAEPAPGHDPEVAA